MNREQLTNVRTEAQINAQCASWALEATEYAKWICMAVRPTDAILRRCVTGQVVAELADKIYALRSQQVTP
jgi:hypothetical protein